MRAGELRALLWEDVDLRHGLIHVHRAAERRSRATKGTKKKHPRRIPIEPSLLPLLEVMRSGHDVHDRVVAVPVDLARPLRGFLNRAGINRVEQHEPKPTRKAMAFHDLRATGITWQAVRGDEPLRIMQRAGHRGVATTMGYARTAEELRSGFGHVFQPLPVCMFGGAEHVIDARSVAKGTRKSTRRAQPRKIWRKRTGIEPARDSRTAPHRF